MKRSIVVMLIFIIISSLFTGCWSKRELNELSIAVGMGIDKNDDKYVVSIQLMNPSEIAAQKSSGQRAATVVYKAEGRNIFEALRRLTKVTSRKIYLSHIRIIVFGEDLAREGVGNLLDFLSRDHDMRSNVYTLVAKNTKAENILSVLTIIEKIAAEKVYLSLETAEKTWAAARVVKLSDLVNSVSSTGVEPVINGVFITGNAEIGGSRENIEKSQPFSILHIDNIGAFKKDKLIGWLNEIESIGYNEIMGNVKSTIITIDSPKANNLGIEIMSTKSSVKGKVENGKPKIYIDFQATGNIGEAQSDIDLTKIESIDEIEEALEKKLEKNMKLVIERAQKDLQSDIFGFGEAIHRSNVKEWRKLEKNWDKEFRNLSVSINVTATIRGLGTITKPVTGEIKE